MQRRHVNLYQYMYKKEYFFNGPSIAPNIFIAAVPNVYDPCQCWLC